MRQMSDVSQSPSLLFPFPIVFLSFICYNVQDIFKKME